VLPRSRADFDVDRSDRNERKPDLTRREPPKGPSRADDTSGGGSRGYQPPSRGGYAHAPRGGGRPDPYGRDRLDYDRPLDRRAIEEGRRRREEERARGVVYTDSGESE
jgi:U4/U6.U5 tri-snRNP-associated protein 3